MASKFLHDMVGQNLTALGLQLDLARMDLEEAAPETCARIGEIQKVLETIMEQVRDYSYHLNPSAVERAGLRSALDRLLTHMRERFTGGAAAECRPVSQARSASGFGVLSHRPGGHRERRATFQLLRHRNRGKVHTYGPPLEVRDNGRGFDPADIASGGRGLGLLSMEHYAAQAGLDLSIASDQKRAPPYGPR